MAEFSDDDMEARLDRAIETADGAPPREALQALRGVRSELDARLAQVPTSASTHDDLARCVAAIARVHTRLGNPEASLLALDEAILYRRKAADLDALGGGRLAEIASLRLTRANSMCLAGRLDDALVESRRAARSVEGLIAAGAGDGEAFLRFVAADARRQIAWLLPRLGDPDGELAERESALVHGRRGMELDGGEESFRAHAAALREVSGPRAEAGDVDGAVDALHEARRVLEAAARREPHHIPWQQDLATTIAWTGRILRSVGRHDQARGELDNATFLVESLLSLSPDDPTLRVEYVRRLEEQGDMDLEGGDPEAAVVRYAARLDAARRLLADDPMEEGRALVDVARAHRAKGGADVAADALHEAVAAFGRAAPADLNAREALADAYDRLASALDASDDADGTLAARRHCVDVRRALHRDVPAHDHAAHALIVALGDLGDTLAERGLSDEAADVHREGLAIARARAARFGDAAAPYAEVAVAEASLASVLARSDRPEDALPHAAAAVAARRHAATAVADLARFLCWDLRRLGVLCGLANDSAAAIEALREAAQIADLGWSEADDDTRPAWMLAVAAAHDALGDALEDRGDDDGALESADAERAAAEDWASYLEADSAAWRHAACAHEDAALLAQRVASSEEALPRFDDAVRARRRALELSSPLDGDSRRGLSYALYVRAACRRAAGALPQALDDARESLAIDRALLATDADDPVLLRSFAASLKAVVWIAEALDETTLFESTAREEVAARRRLAEDGDVDDVRALGWALYGHSAALRDLGRAADAMPLATAGVAIAESLALDTGADDGTTGDLDAIGLLTNVSEVAADVADREDAEGVALARHLYERNVRLHERHRPEDIGHAADCTCLADNRRKLSELGAVAPPPQDDAPPDA